MRKTRGVTWQDGERLIAMRHAERKLKQEEEARLAQFKANAPASLKPLRSI